MRIERLETVPYALPFHDLYVTARGTLQRRELLLVRLRTSGGPIGLGEAAPLALRGGPDLAEIDRELHARCAPLLEGAKVTTASLPGLIEAIRGSGVSAQALASIDLALHDLAGKAEGEPVWRLLGAAHARPVRCNATLVAAAPEDVAAAAARWVEDGFGTLKLKVGMEGDSEQVAAVREAVGPGPRIRVDANGAWSPAEAVDRLEAMSGHDLELAEQPAADLEGLGRVRRAVRPPIAADESVVDAEDARCAVELGACDLATVKIAKSGGIAAALEVAREIPVYLSSALDGPVGIAGAAHLAQLLPSVAPAAGLAHGLATQTLMAATIAARGPDLEGSELRLPDEPGLGVEIDELALARHRL
jgi:L-alanine-DL-glutamate epimerase-like enolase superfamily enzyme